MGGEDPIFGRRIGYIGSFTYSNGQEIRSDETRSLIISSSNGFQPLNPLADGLDHTQAGIGR